MRLIWDLIFGKANRTYPSAIILYSSSQLCWKLHFNNFNFGSLDWSCSGSASSCSVDISAVSSLCCCPKNAESLYLFWHQFVFMHIKRGALIYIIYVPHIVFIQTIKCRGTSENWAFMSYSLDVGSYFTCKILHEEKLHFLVSFSFKKQFEVHQNDPEHVFEGDTFA